MRKAKTQKTGYSIVARKKHWKKYAYVFTVICTRINTCTWKYIWKKIHQVVNIGYWE